MTFPVIPGLVSIVVASYNHAEYLTQRMDSLIAQTYSNIEIIVIDDHSTDNSLEILRRYESLPKVNLIVREENGGWVTVSNQGVELSSGEFVIFANCDDDCDPYMIEYLVSILQRYPKAGISFCRSLMIDSRNNIIGDDFFYREKAFKRLCTFDRLIAKREMTLFLLYSCVIPNLSAALIRKECLFEVGVLSHDYKVCSDWDLFLRISTRFDFAYVTKALNKFRQHRTTIRSQTKERIVIEEYLRLLLPLIKITDISQLKKTRYKIRVMYMWATHLILPSMSGLKNFKFHVEKVIKYDRYAIFYLPLALIIRLFALLIYLYKTKISS